MARRDGREGFSLSIHGLGLQSYHHTRQLWLLPKMSYPPHLCHPSIPLITIPYILPMVITNLEEKENRKIWVPIRGGNRGGWSLFEWEKVRDMPYRDREMYLGNSAKLGVLDKGGKWRKKDWYLKRNHLEGDELELQRNEAMRRDQERFNAALGISPADDEEQLTPAEMQLMLARIKGGKEEGGFVAPGSEGGAVGLGFDKAKVEIRAKPSTKVENPHRLEGTVEEWVKVEARDSEGEARVRVKKQRKEKKEKKEKKDKHKHRDRDGERPDSRSPPRKKHEEDSEQQRKKKKKHRHRSPSKSPSHQRHRERRHSPSESRQKEHRRHKEERHERSRNEKHSKKHRYDSD